jgi:CubicO group peptidase (beta-lactamase class C family)
MRRLGSVPLAYQPGERWLYQTAASVLGVLVARAGGVPLGELLGDRILAPLGMRSTGFCPPPSAIGRLGPHWAPGADGGAPQLYDPADGQWAVPPAFPDGGDGLVSTVDDLAAFAALSAGGIAGDGSRVLSGDAVRAMTTGRIPTDEDGGGWGLGLGVRLADEPGGRHAGSYGWDGGLGSSWWTDPVSGVTAILLTNQAWTSPTPPPVFVEFLRAAFGGGRE